MGIVKLRTDKDAEKENARGEMGASIASAESAYLAVQALTIEIMNRIDLSGGSLDRNGILMGLHGLTNAINMLNKYASDVQDIAQRMTLEASDEYLAIANDIKAKLALLRRSAELGIGEMPDPEMEHMIDSSDQLTEHEKFIAKVLLYNERLMELRAYLIPIASLARSLRR